MRLPRLVKFFFFPLFVPCDLLIWLDPKDKCTLLSVWTGAHIGPEPTTDRFVVVMVSQLTLTFLFYLWRLIKFKWTIEMF